MASNDYFQNLIDQVKTKISIPDLVSLTNNRAKCLIHGNKKSPSFQYFPATETWHCFKCKDTGDVIKLYGILNNLSYKDAVIVLCQNYKIPLE